MEITKQFLLTPSAGKRLIAKAMLHIDEVKQALEKNTVVIIAGTTNAYIAEEMLDAVGQRQDFSRKGFVRGITLPPSYKLNEAGRLPGDNGFAGDVVIRNGKWEKNVDIFDVVDSLRKGDVIIKGANAVNLSDMEVGIQIGHPKGGTIMAALQAMVGRRVSLYLPVGLEKRVSDNIGDIAHKLNAQNASGCRLLPVSGHVITELEAINTVSGSSAQLVAAGGVCGAEGGCWIAVTGEKQQVSAAEALIKTVINEPAYAL